MACKAGAHADAAVACGSELTQMPQRRAPRSRALLQSLGETKA